MILYKEQTSWMTLLNVLMNFLMSCLIKKSITTLTRENNSIY